MKLPSLQIGNLKAKFPLIQGGMSIRVSTSALAVPVADCGGIGVIGGSGILADELKEDVLRAKAATDGIVGVNIMYAVKNFYELVTGSIEAGVDLMELQIPFSEPISCRVQMFGWFSWETTRASRSKRWRRSPSSCSVASATRSARA